ncbi:hypothetical protein BU24DRAFT_427091 [Aaosphaeria arxii CBS 175.79]|uniref:Zn(2)-C6 fungal-type domain-containing protein n=1 Tax=Aaosphaeria arxii CBS 175.79 TaxID=1450172 RepID=A0A6A5XCQ8_9PLEO|nr:uncharacterized protein BU24DRAFT_427091 [Aaosphaeria arxii CBS 175.79]KAF2010895.1 hypothetical protein BU24DRAFT_427091 [Aaosphaeria arxii CBS 175.79]
MEEETIPWRIGSQGRKPRTLVSCLPCHRRKVKCDREQPCNRCLIAGRSNDCIYQNPRSPRASFPAIGAFIDGKARLARANSWASLCWEFEEARPYLFGLDPEFRAMYDKVEGLKSLFLSSNGRFANKDNLQIASASLRLSKSELLSYISDRGVIDTLLSNYMQTFNRILPLWNPTLFDEEIARFWDSPEDADLTSFAQLFVMLGLSCHSAPANTSTLRKHDLSEMSKTFFTIGEAAFNNSRFKSLHDLAGVRTLCMMIIARMIDLVPMHDTQDGTLLFGLTVRAAQNMALNRHPSLFSGMPENEGINRIIIWTTIVFMDQFISIHFHLPPLIRREDHDATFEFSIQDGSTTSNYGIWEERLKDSSDENQLAFLALMSALLPTVSVILEQLHSTKPALNYEEVGKLNKKLRDSLSLAMQLAMGKMEGATSADVSMQRGLLEIFIRRVLLDLHQPFAITQEASANAEHSRLAVLECALALMICQEGIFEAAGQHSQMKCLLDLFKDDFGIAIIYVTLGIRRGDFTVSPVDTLQAPPEEVAWTALRRATELTEWYTGVSVKHFRIYAGAMYLVAALEALETGAPMMQKMMEAGHMIIAAIEKRKGKGAECGNQTTLHTNISMFEGFGEPEEMGGFINALGLSSGNAELPAVNPCFYTFQS